MILALFLACSGPRPAAELPPAEPPPTAVATDAPATGTPATDTPAPAGATPVDGAGNPAPTPEPLLTPAASYASCQDRVEGPQSAGECKTDADCTKVGCSQEVCVASAKAQDVMTTCEILPCFGALDSCGCHEGVCSWTLATAMPAPGRIELPAK